MFDLLYNNNNNNTTKIGLMAVFFTNEAGSCWILTPDFSILPDHAYLPNSACTL